MSRKGWIWIRLGGWGLLFLSFVVYEVNLFIPLFDAWILNVVNGVLGGIGTFCVMVGYYMLVRDELKRLNSR